MRRKTAQSKFARILAKVGNPPSVRLVSETEFRELTGVGLGHYVGRSSPSCRIIALRYNQPDDDIINTMWHELAHILFPNKPHWWIECFAAKMHPTDTKYAGRYSFRYAHDPADLPSKAKCLELARKAAHKLEPKG